MKIKFLLHGGRLKYKDERNDTYFQELTKDLVDGDTILFVGFAVMSPTYYELKISARTHRVGGAGPLRLN